MSILELKRTFVTALEMNTEPALSGAKLTLKHNYTYNVKYGSDNLCRAELTCDISAEGVEMPLVKFTYAGIFSYAAGVAKEELHRQSYTELFPFAKAYCATVTSLAGIAPIYIAPVDISSSQIVRFDMNGFKKD